MIENNSLTLPSNIPSFTDTPNLPDSYRKDREKAYKIISMITTACLQENPSPVLLNENVRHAIGYHWETKSPLGEKINKLTNNMLNGWDWNRKELKTKQFKEARMLAFMAIKYQSMNYVPALLQKIALLQPQSSSFVEKLSQKLHFPL